MVIGSNGFRLTNTIPYSCPPAATIIVGAGRQVKSGKRQTKLCEIKYIPKRVRATVGKKSEF